jgi:hypothetical protein
MELIRFEQKFNVSKTKAKPPKGPAIDKIYKSGANFYLSHKCNLPEA